MHKCKLVDIKVFSGTQVNIIIEPVELFNEKEYCFELCLNKKQIREYSKIIGTELVYVQNGCGGENIQLWNKAGNIFYGVKLILGCCYVIRFGNNGAPGSVRHFLNLNTPKCSRAYDPANSDTGTITTDSLAAREA